MKIYAKCPPTKCEYLTSGKEYEVLREEDTCFHAVDDVGDNIVERWIEGLHSGGDWERIVCDDAGNDTLTLRDQFAMAALTGWPVTHRCDPAEFARQCYELADAMMEARNK